MAAILHALQGILTIVIMIATGFYLSRKGWFSESFSSAVAQLVTKVCLPTYMIVNLTVNFSHDQLIEMRRSAGTDHFHGIGLFYRPCGSTAAEGAA